MKKFKSFLTNLSLAVLTMMAIVLLSEFVQKVDKEDVNTNYMWNIKYSNVVISEGSKAGNIKLENNSFDLDVTLNNELEFYEFTIDVANNGSLDAKVTKVVNDIQNDRGILTSTVTYLDGSQIKKGDILRAGEKKTIKVRIDYPKQENKVYEALSLKLNFYLGFSAIQK